MSEAPWRRQSSQLPGEDVSPAPGTIAHANAHADDGVNVPPPPPPFPAASVAIGAPPPPPPPPGPVRQPTVRLSTESAESRGSKEPPAAIQNAMMTKDKKPFTYTPGGLDLSQIRSPRMQRRIVRNANSEGVTAADLPQGPKASPLVQSSPLLPPSALAAMQPALPVAVFPLAAGHAGHTGHAGHASPADHAVAASHPPPPPTAERPASPPPKHATPISVGSPPTHQVLAANEPGSIYVPPVAYVPPASAEPSSGEGRRTQVGSLYIPPVSSQQQQQQQQPMSPTVTLNKAPTPWLTQRQTHQPTVPPWAQRTPPPPTTQEPGPTLACQHTEQQAQQYTQQQAQQHAQQQAQQHAQQHAQQQAQQHAQQQAHQQAQQHVQQQAQQHVQQQAHQQAQQHVQQQAQQHAQQQAQQQAQKQPGTRIIPIQVEGRDLPVAAGPSPQPGSNPQRQAQIQAQEPGTRIIPIQLEGIGSVAGPGTGPGMGIVPMQQRRPIYVHNKFTPADPASLASPAPDSPELQNPRQYQQQQNWSSGSGSDPAGTSAPIQSRSFKVLQKITDTDEDKMLQQYQQSTQGVPVSELRKLQLSDDDRALMNKFKAQVDDETYLHNESDPRYRGPSIPSRAFRMLQHMTDAGAGSGEEGGMQHQGHQVPHGSVPVRGPPIHTLSLQATTDTLPQPYIPPSEQQAPEPRKYVGSNIPSRSFRMLQAMTASPDSCGPGESEL